MFASLKHRLILQLARHLLPIVEAKSVISFSKRGELFLNGEQATPQQAANLREEIKTLETLEVWGLLTKHLSNVARKRMVEESTDWTDMLVGKMILYTLDVQQKVVEQIKASDRPPITDLRQKALQTLNRGKERLMDLAK